MERTLCDRVHTLDAEGIAPNRPKLYSLIIMSLTLEIVSRHSRALGKKRVMTFGQDGGTIGRSVEADWSLPDAKRFLSGRHASIDFRSGSYYIVDTSKNGVFINGSDEPVGKGHPQRLFPGDRIRIGDYEMTVSIEHVDDTRETLMSMSHVDPVDARQLVESPEPTGIDLVDASAITGVGIEMYLEDDDVETLKPPGDEPGTGESGSESSSLDAFFRGAGLDPVAMSPKQADAMLQLLGQVTRELIGGVIESLHLRALQKAQLKQTTTIIEPRENNRLKFSANFEEGFARLFLDDTGDYSSPVESVRGAFADIRDHQRSLLNATREALFEYLERLDPEEIEHRASNGRSALISAANKFKFWDIYKEVYLVLANRQPGELPQAFLDAFADAYSDSAETKKTDKKPPTALEAG